MLKNALGGAAGGYGCAIRLCTLKSRTPFLAVRYYYSGGQSRGGYTNAGAGTQRRLDREELYVQERRVICAGT